MSRHLWNELPGSVRAAVERECGPVAGVEVPPAGRNSDFAATLHLVGGAVFCKGIAGADGPRARMHRHEAYINRWLPKTSPRLLWQIEVDGWLLLGFDHVAGRHADLSPGSADLPLLSDAVSTLADELDQCPAEAPELARKWAGLSGWRRLAASIPDDLDEWARRHVAQLVAWEARAVELVTGDSLVHTDLHALNILISGGKAWVVDWAWSRRGNAAVDIASLVIRLIGAGHTTPAAERWANAIPVWAGTGEETRTAFAVAIWGAWEFLQRDQPLPHRAELTASARAWARHRLRCGRVRGTRVQTSI